MNSIVFGPEKPKINFTQLPSGAYSFSVKNEYVIDLADGQSDVTWGDLLLPDWMFIASNEQVDEQEFKIHLLPKLFKVTGSEAENKFLLNYVGLCFQGLKDNINSLASIWEYPALIPQVWVNWIHYDPSDKSRAVRAQREPFRVDFMIKHSLLEAGQVIIEVDGSSHIGAFSGNPDAAMDAYTTHVRKDRWLRKKGWSVVRITNKEVEECVTLDDFISLFAELTGLYLAIPF